MKESARLKAIDELLTLLLMPEQNKPADTIFVDYCRSRRYIGSSDRKYIADGFFEILRFYHGYANALKGALTPRLLALTYWAERNDTNFARLIQEQAETTAPFAHRYQIKCPNAHESVLIVRALSILKDQPIVLPQWCMPYFQGLPGDLNEHIKSLHQSASFDIRVNPLKATRPEALEFFKKSGIVAEPTAISPLGIRLKNRIPLQELSIWKVGMIEVQDEGAQLVALLSGVKSSDQVLDYCAGAGGKTLLMAAMMHNKGRIIATDLYPWRLKQGANRYKRAGVHNVQIKDLSDTKWWKRHQETFDCVLIDVPCSGSGTWRRNPDLKLFFGEKDLKEVCQKQREILEKTKHYVKPGGQLVYATCSLWPIENDGQIKAFLANNPEFEIVPLDTHELLASAQQPFATETGIQLCPLYHETDGFFVSVLQRRCL
ncbi:MAG: RsmB/NOP family class I SAM-dependent RNA methyltransferase [Alphaproteobacteria bacterium]|nr:RsmB/NOP family class I SAM-dependent RNA methyltransferase [Alphaproteobacteria bacterium]